LKKKEQECETLRWENNGLKASLEMLHQNYEAIAAKNNLLREELGRIEREK